MDGPKVLYEEGPCLVVAKPAGILTQAPPGIDSMEQQVRAWIRQRKRKTGNFYLGVPHRLDRPVSGALAFARHVRACRRLSEQFAGRVVRKIYWAVVEGVLDSAAGEWHDWMRKIPGRAKSEIVAADHPDAREARLQYRLLGQTPAGSLLKITLETGRMHQIRLQAAHRGFPILGDQLYGARLPFGEPHEDERLRSIGLHGRFLSFLHPMTHERVEVEAPLPAEWHTLEIPTQSL